MDKKTASQNTVLSIGKAPETKSMSPAEALTTMANYCKTNHLPMVKFKAKTGPYVLLLNLGHEENRGIQTTDLKKIHAASGVAGIWIAKSASEMSANYTKKREAA